MRRILVLNSLSGGAQLLVSTLLILITVPIFITNMGIKSYGVFSLILIINNFSFFFGLGINSGLIKFLSEQGKSINSNVDILTAYILLIIALTPFTILGLIFNYLIMKNLLNIPVELINTDTIWFFNFLIIANLFQFIGQVPVSILDSLQKIYLTSFYQTLYQILYWGLMIISIYLFGTLKMVGLVILLSTFIWFLLIFKTSITYWGKIKLSDLKNNFISSIKKQISYTYKIYLGGLINFFYEPLTKILIASFLGIAEVGFFDIILRVRNQLWNLITKLIYPLFPFISQLKDIFSIRNVIHDVEQKLVFIVFFLIAVLTYIVPDFVNIWLKTDETKISMGLLLILVSNSIGIIVIPLYQFLVLKGYPEKTIILQSLNVAVNLIIFFLFYKILGFLAVILGNMSAILASFGLCVYYQKIYLNSLIFDNINQFLKAMFFFLLVAVIGFVLDKAITNSFLEISLLPFVLFLFALLFIRLLRIISPKDILNYSGENKKIQNFLTKIFIMPGRSIW